jgi:hypothetical protein
MQPLTLYIYIKHSTLHEQRGEALKSTKMALLRSRCAYIAYLVFLCWGLLSAHRVLITAKDEAAEKAGIGIQGGIWSSGSGRGVEGQGSIGVNPGLGFGIGGGVSGSITGSGQGGGGSGSTPWFSIPTFGIGGSISSGTDSSTTCVDHCAPCKCDYGNHKTSMGDIEDRSGLKSSTDGSNG